MYSWMQGEATPAKPTLSSVVCRMPKCGVRQVEGVGGVRGVKGVGGVVGVVE